MQVLLHEAQENSQFRSIFQRNLSFSFEQELGEALQGYMQVDKAHTSKQRFKVKQLRVRILTLPYPSPLHHHAPQVNKQQHPIEHLVVERTNILNPLNVRWHHKQLTHKHFRPRLPQ